MNIEARPWRTQDLLDDLQQIIEEEPDRYPNTRRTTLCMARDFLKEHFAGLSNEPLTLEELCGKVDEPVWVESPGVREYGRWAIVEDVDAKHKALILRGDFTCHDYGTVWLAYRRKPENTGGWVSTQDCLPEPGKEVLLLAHGWKGRLHYIGKLEPCPAQEGFFGVSKASEWTIWGWSYFREPKVTHWMPLPEPPAEENIGICGCTGRPCSECQPGPCDHRTAGGTSEQS